MADVVRVVDNGAEERRLRGRRDAGVWSIVVGAAMMFLGGVSASFAVGGAMMCIGGAATAGYWGWRLRKVRGDPWQDPEIDAWEREHLLSGKR
ncbi:MAG TPA: hypothetical protein VFH47_06470 [Candidatus Thermoplasmatota archaeon]|nr:hypothetical protein [Candidatus Thermoplasmatota archaeon]